MASSVWVKKVEADVVVVVSWKEDGKPCAEEKDACEVKGDLTADD